jgi:alpha-L-fucosidase
MKKLILFILLTALAAGVAFDPSISAAASQNTGPTREARLRWWREARFGMMISWGLYAVPAGVWKGRSHPDNYAEWIMYDEKIPVREYAGLAAQFNPGKFDARAWAELAKKAGMRYVIPLAKHHDGFSMYKSALTDFDIVDATPFKRDFVGELGEACRAAGLKYGLYYSVDRDWRRPTGPGNRFKQSNTWDFPASPKEDFDTYFRDFAKPQVEELLRLYRPDVLWFDGIGMKSDSQLDALVGMIRTLVPGCLINSRIKTFINPQPDPYRFCDYISLGDNEIADQAQGFDWENPGTINDTYGYSKLDRRWIEAGEILFRLCDIVSKGGNYLLNVGPTAEGLIPQESVDRLLEVGKWLETNGEAIYGTESWRVYGQGPRFDQDAVRASARKAGKGKAAETVAPTSASGAGGLDIRFTAKGKTVYAICLGTPGKRIVVPALGLRTAAEKISAVRLLGSVEKVVWNQTGDGLILDGPKKWPERFAGVYRIDLR